MARKRSTFLEKKGNIFEEKRPFLEKRDNF